MKKLKGVIFDLDGVIADTAGYHYLAWKQIADELSIEINEEFNEQLKGIDRRNSMLRILEFGNKSLLDNQIEEYMERKNLIYLRLLSNLTKNDILPGIDKLFRHLIDCDIKIAIASASKNAPEILERLGLFEYVDYIADPSLIAKPKPAPDIFIIAAEGIGCQLEQCVAIEDSIAGIEAINSAGIKSVSIGLCNVNADLELKQTKDLKLKKIKELLNS